MKKRNILSLWAAALGTCFLQTACVGPLVSQETAQTVGYHRHEIVGGGGQAGALVKYNFGLGENLDVGAQWESLSIGLRMKYALLNEHEEGFSLALAGGLGSSIGGSHYYGDLMASYLTGRMEPYGTFRMVHVKIDPVEFKDSNSGQTVFTVDLGDYSYAEAILGTRIWLTRHWLLSFEAATLMSMTSGLSFTNSLIVDGAFGYRF